MDVVPYHHISSSAMKLVVTGVISILSKHAANPEIEHPAASWNWADLNFYEKYEFDHDSWKELTSMSVNSSLQPKSSSTMRFAVTGLISVLVKHAADPEIEHP